MDCDLLITGGTIVDGTGQDRFVGDVAITGNKVAAIGPDLAESCNAAETIDATGKLVTPGFVDVHTHYDGQVTWDDELNPSAGHGVTTLVMGNCGVGFAPVRPGSEEWLIQLMEGVEDIPGAALSEGITWGWESFPQYLDVLDERKLAVDVSAQVAHGAVRAYVMGARGARNEDATPEDIAEMSAIVQEALEAGAVGVSTSRTIAHKAIDGEPVPGTFAAEEELVGLGQAVHRAGNGVFELAPAGTAGLDLIAPHKELDWMRRLSIEFELPVTYALLQLDPAPTLWEEMMEESLRATADGARLYPQVAARPFGLLMSLETHHPFGKRPTYKQLASTLSHDELVAELSKPATRATILAEDDLPADPSIHMDGMTGVMTMFLNKAFVLGDPPDYEPGPERSLAAIAEANGLDPLEVAYDTLLEHDGRQVAMVPLFNYTDGNHDAIREQLLHPQSVSGLSDGGAHCGMICDASIPTYMLTHWARDRSRGEKLPLEWVVKKQTLDTATLFGFEDRGVLAQGKRADLNVIDHEGLQLMAPRMAYDLPAGGRRLLQEARGYDATIVGGTITRRHGADTGARPGRLVRG